ncbi:hypothetical protein [Proteus mirabilis]|nr:hypothetical protein [Proteus mirabilis]
MKGLIYLSQKLHRFCVAPLTTSRWLNITIDFKLATGILVAKAGLISQSA